MALTCHLIKISLHVIDKIWKCKRTILCITYNLLLKINYEKHLLFVSLFDLGGFSFIVLFAFLRAQW